MSKLKFEKENNKEGKGKGFYIALAVCLIAIGAAAWTTYDSVTEFINPQDEGATNHYTTDVENDFSRELETAQSISGVTNDSPIIENPANYQTNGHSEQKDTASSHSEKVTNARAEEKDSLIVYPSGRDVIKGFSGTNPVFSKTLNDWRVHNGVDFSAEQGSMIKAVSDGKVSDVYEDPALGKTIVIEHDAGFTAYYSGLGDTTLVQKGDSVSTGQEIGSLNDIPAEASDGSHMHFAVKKSEQWIDPLSILKDAHS